MMSKNANLKGSTERKALDAPMSPKIRILDEHTINKIAAGEVIENPASVVKELVENAIDAGSTEICVEIKGGGRQLVRVTDNGCGMSSDDALLCLERHATSKIRTVEEIHELSTMGFRGEAVPSIAAISKFSILTRSPEKDSSEGTMVLVEGGKIIKCCPVACSSGTTMEVKSLFFNVPVRKKFQKSPAHDANEILKTLTLISLGHPHIKFRLINDQETILNAPLPKGSSFVEQLKERIGSVLGGDYIEGCIPIEGGNGEYHIHGWIGMPFHHRQNRTGQHLFINHRGIQSPLVGFAVKDGYGTTLPAQRHPIYVLHLTMAGGLVDVNVHPQKREVRLRQEHILRELIVESVRQGLQKSGNPQRELLNPLQSPVESPPLILPQLRAYAPSVSPCFSPAPPIAYKEAIETSATYSPLPLPLPQEFAFDMPPKPMRNIPKVIASIPRYLILEGTPEDAPIRKSGLCLVDQRAAHARVIFEKLCRRRSLAPLETEHLLIPHTIELPPTDAQTLKQHVNMLENLGIGLKEFGRHSFLLDALPSVMGNIDPTTFIQEVISTLNEAGTAKLLEEHVNRRIALAAVRASVVTDRRLTITEGQALIGQLFACDTPWYCPQGKPTLATIASEEICKFFL